MITWTANDGGQTEWSESSRLGPLTLMVFDVGKIGPLGQCYDRPQWAMMISTKACLPGSKVVVGYGHSSGGMEMARRECVRAAVASCHEFKRRSAKDDPARADARRWMNEGRQWLSLDAGAVKRKRTLILSCARSGSKYISEVLSECGLDVGHEAVGNDVTVGFMYACEKVKFADFDGVGTYDTILHQVREPLAVIGSCQTLRTSSWRVIFEELGWLASDMAGNSEGAHERMVLKRCMRFWLEWNRKCARLAGRAPHTVEGLADGGPSVGFLAGRLDVDSVLLRRKLDSVSSDTNTREHGSVTWGMLRAIDGRLAAEVAELAALYGYAVETGT